MDVCIRIDDVLLIISELYQVARRLEMKVLNEFHPYYKS
jgi:hypothetical protein